MKTLASNAIRGHPLAAIIAGIIHGSGVQAARSTLCQCTPEVPALPAPIDNRWNKKLEFVYSLVTQIRAAIRATLCCPPLLLFVSLPPFPPPSSRRVESSRATITRTFQLFLRHRYPTSSRFARVTDIDNAPTPTTGATSIPRCPRKRATTTTSTCRLVPTLSPTPPPSPLPRPFPSFRSVRRVCPSFYRMHLSNVETNW